MLAEVSSVISNSSLWENAQEIAWHSKQIQKHNPTFYLIVKNLITNANLWSYQRDDILLSNIVKFRNLIIWALFLFSIVLFFSIVECHQCLLNADYEHMSRYSLKNFKNIKCFMFPFNNLIPEVKNWILGK